MVITVMTESDKKNLVVIAKIAAGAAFLVASFYAIEAYGRIQREANDPCRYMSLDKLDQSHPELGDLVSQRRLRLEQEGREFERYEAQSNIRSAQADAAILQMEQDNTPHDEAIAAITANSKREAQAFDQMLAGWDAHKNQFIANCRRSITRTK